MEKNNIPFPKVPSNIISASWAPILFEPVLGSDERITIGVGTISHTGEVRCHATITPKGSKRIFGSDKDLLNYIIKITLTSIQEHLEKTHSFDNWVPPTSGVYKGGTRQITAQNLDEAIKFILPTASCLVYGEDLFNEDMHKDHQKENKINWAGGLREIVLKSRPELLGNFDAKVFLGSYDVPAKFTFLNPKFAANLVALNPASLTRSVKDARADLWNLHLLSDAPNFLFRPEKKALFAGIYTDTSVKNYSDNVKDAVHELKEEASRRSVIVKEVTSSDEAAKYLMSYAN